MARLRDRGIGILITDHNVRETLAITDRAYILYDGKILVSGTASEIANNPIAREIYLGREIRPLGRLRGRDVAMAMEARLSLRQSQRVVMTPLLQQAIQLLQLSTLELQEVVQKELLENPLLEEVAPETGDGPEAAAAPSTPDAPAPTPVEPAPVESSPTAERQTDDLPFDLTAVMFDDNNDERSLVAQEEREELPFENIVRSVNSLTDHLDEQLRFTVEDPLVRRIGNEIIGNLDEDGYLRAELGEIAERCQTTLEQVEKVLRLIQAFDPPGVAARIDPGVPAHPAQDRSQPRPGVGRDRRGTLRRAEPPSLSRHRAGPEAAARPRHGVGRGDPWGWSPSPAAVSGGPTPATSCPTWSCTRWATEYVVVLNEDGIPRLRVNSLYRSLLRNYGDEARAVRGAEAALGRVAHQERSTSASARCARSPSRSSSSSAISSTRACRTCARCRCVTSARTSACTSRRSAG